MKRHLLKFFTLAIVVLLSSCSNNDDVDTITEQTIPGCFAYVTDIANGPSAYYTGLGYKIRLNYSAPSAEVTVSGLKLTDGTSLPTFTLSNLDFTIDKDGWVVVSGENLYTAPIYSSALSTIISRFKMRLYQRMLDQSYVPAISVNMTVDQQYSVVSTLPGQTCFGTTASTATGVDFKTTSTVYQMAFNTDTRCADLSIYGAQFMDRMPAMDIVIRNIPFRIENGKAVLEIASVTPESGGTPYPAFPITNLKGTMDFGGSFALDFNCTPAMFQGLVFSVSANLGFQIAE